MIRFNQLLWAEWHNFWISVENPLIATRLFFTASKNRTLEMMISRQRLFWNTSYRLAFLRIYWWLSSIGNWWLDWMWAGVAVFGVTTAFSIFAYLWLIIVLLAWTPGEVPSFSVGPNFEWISDVRYELVDELIHWTDRTWRLEINDTLFRWQLQRRGWHFWCSHCWWLFPTSPTGDCPFATSRHKWLQMMPMASKSNSVPFSPVSVSYFNSKVHSVRRNSKQQEQQQQ